MAKQKRRARNYKIIITLDLDAKFPKNIFNNIASYYSALNKIMRQNRFAKSLYNKRIPHNTYCSVDNFFYDDIDIIQLIDELRDTLDQANIKCMRLFGCIFKLSDYHRKNRNRKRPHGNSRKRNKK